MWCSFFWLFFLLIFFFYVFTLSLSRVELLSLKLYEKLFEILYFCFLQRIDLKRSHIFIVMIVCIQKSIPNCVWKLKLVKISLILICNFLGNWMFELVCLLIYNTLRTIISMFNKTNFNWISYKFQLPKYQILSLNSIVWYIYR